MALGRCVKKSVYTSGFVVFLLSAIFVCVLYALASLRTCSDCTHVDDVKLTRESKLFHSARLKLFEPVTPNQRTATKVIVLTYARSGSSFMGELFNQNPNAFYYFEPLSGIYSYLYGISYSMPSSECYSYKNRTARYPSEYEASVITHQLDNLLSCHFDRTPVEALQDKFSMDFNKQEKFNDYKSCVGYKWVRKTASKPKPKGESQHNNTVPKRHLLSHETHTLNTTTTVNRGTALHLNLNRVLNTHNLTLPNQSKAPHVTLTPAYKCKYLLQNHCGKYFDGKREVDCFQNIYGFKYPGTNPESGVGATPFEVQSEKNLRSLKGKSTSKYAAFVKHNSCIDKSKTASEKCTPALEKKCSNSSIVAAKVIRLRMETVEELLRVDPSIKVIHYLRDPRGMENSRSIGMKKKNEGMILDATLTCPKMLRDIQMRKELEERYPKTFMELMYEDLAETPVETAKRVYDFLGQNMPREVSDWLVVNTHLKNRKSNLDPLSTSRSNSSATAARWKVAMGKETMKKLTLICKDALQELGILTV